MRELQIVLVAGVRRQGTVSDREGKGLRTGEFTGEVVGAIDRFCRGQ